MPMTNWSAGTTAIAAVVSAGGVVFVAGQIREARRARGVSEVAAYNDTKARLDEQAARRSARRSPGLAAARRLPLWWHSAALASSPPLDGREHEHGDWCLQYDLQPVRRRSYWISREDGRQLPAPPEPPRK